MNAPRLDLSLMPDNLAVCRLGPETAVPAWALTGPFFSITRTAEELSIVCAEALAGEAAVVERGWRAFKVAGPLDFGLVGILADLAGVLAAAQVSLFAVSTFDTDYLLVKAGQLEAASAALRTAGHHLVD